ncbi:MAG: dicarboxylate/amino acid:cation symporter [Phycisphaerales bacterium]|nr:dicarboxylate/amino acid:cation symporter [Phycisphaerales bacterium]
MKKKGIALHWQITIGLVLGIIAGVVANQLWTTATWAAVGVNDSAAYMAGTRHAPGTADPNAEAGVVAVTVKFASSLTDFVGKLFLRCLRFIAVPIVLFSLVVGVASLGDPRKLGRIGTKTLMWFILTTVAAAVIGLGLSNAVKPGGDAFVSPEKRVELLAAQAAGAQSRIAAGEKIRSEASVWQQLIDVVPANPFAALASGEMLQVVFLSVTLGLGLTMIPRGKSDVVVRVCDGVQDALILLVRALMTLAPYAVFALMAKTVAGLGLDVLGALLVYCLVVLAGLALVLTVMYPTFLWALTPRGNKVGFKRFFRALAPAQLLAISSSSSAATLPVTMECARDRLGVADEITSFVCPLGATVNMAGTALYQAVAATFVAQLYGIQLTLTDQASIVMLATLIAVGSPGVPGGSIVMMVIVLESIGVPPEGIAVLMAVDRVLDMGRTVVNISGDAAVAAVVAASEGKLLTEAEVRAAAAAVEAA